MQALLKFRLSFLSLTAVLFLGGLSAQVLATEQVVAHSATSASTVVLTEGLVRKLDQSAGKITLSHGPLPNGMQGMTMAFRVKNPAWLNSLKVGQKVRFAIDDRLTIVRLEAAQ